MYFLQREKEKSVHRVGRNWFSVYSLTRGPRSLPPEIIHAVEGAHAQEAAKLGVAGLELQLDLQRVCIGVAAVHDVPNGTWVAALRHEHLCGVVQGLILQGLSAKAQRSQGKTFQKIPD